MTSLFISYSRKDIEAARKLTESFKGQDLDFWIDWEGIPPTVDWWKEIERGIEQANIFVFLISPDSVKSKICRQEIDHAVKNGKRLIPIVVRDIKAEESPEVLRSLNWIFLREGDDFDQSFNKLITAIKTDYEWVQVHSQLQVKALEWERSRLENSILLRGKELQDAEFQLAKNSSKEPHPTDLQREYVFSSRKAADRQRRSFTVGAITIAIALLGLGIFSTIKAVDATNQASAAQAANTLAVSNANTAEAASTLATANQQLAEERAKIARASELATQSLSVRDTQLDLASLLGIEAFDTWDFLRTRAALANNLNTNPHLHQYMYRHTGWVSAVAFNPKKDELASIGCLAHTGTDCTEKGIILWSIPNGQLNKIISIRTSTADNLAFNSDGTILATGGCAKPEGFKCLQGEVNLWDMKTNQQVGSFNHGQPNNIQSLAFSPDGKFLAVGGCADSELSSCTEGEILVWDVATRSQIGETIRRNSSGVENVLFSPDGQFLAASGWDETILVWRFQNGQISEPVLSLSSFLDGFVNIAFSPDGKTLLSGGTYNRLDLWDLTNGQLLHEYVGHDNSIYAVAFSPDGRLLASGSSDETLIVWNKDSGTPIETLHGHSGIVTSVAFSPNGKYLASTSEDGRVILWDIENDLPLGNMLPMAGFTLMSASFRSDGNIITTDLRNDEIIVSTDSRNTAVGKPIKEFPGGFSSVMALSSDDEIIAMGGEGLIYLANITNGNPMLDRPITGQQGWVTALAISPDKSVLASGGCYHRQENGVCPSGIIYLWDTKSGKQIGNPIIGHTSWVNGLAFSPDGRMLASGSTDDTILLWDVLSRTVIGIPFVGHDNQVTSVSFSPDGKMLASAADDGRIILWDVQTHQPITIINQNRRNSLPVRSTSFSPNGEYLISADADGNIMTWEVNPNQWKQLTCQRVGRNFTRAEWAQYFSNEEYRKTCEQWPLEPEPVSTP